MNTISSFDICKYVLPTQYSLFKSRGIEIYGTFENPLFLVNDIVCRLLEYDSIAKCHFFDENRENVKYVMTSTSSLCSSEL